MPPLFITQNPVIASVHTITPLLWFNDAAEEPAVLYCGIFPNSRLLQTVRWEEAGKEFHQRQPGSALTVAFEFNGVTFTAMKGGPMHRITPAVSIVVHCDTQAEIDDYWTRSGPAATRGPGVLLPERQVRAVVADHPATFPEMLKDLESPTAGRAMGAMIGMKKLDQVAMEAAYAG